MSSVQLNSDGTLFAYGDNVRVERGTFRISVSPEQYNWTTYILRDGKWEIEKSGTEADCRARATELEGA